jgi:predicted small secreted protein
MKRKEKVWLLFVIVMILGFFVLMAMQQGCQTVEGFGHDIVWTSRKVQEGDR